MNEDSHRARRINAEATEKLDPTEKPDAPIGADPTEVLAPVRTPAPAAPPSMAASARSASPASQRNVQASIPQSAASTPTRAPKQPARRRRSVAAPVIVVLGLIASVLLAMYSWGGIFTTAHLACVIAGAVLFTVTGLVALRTCRGTVGLIVAWILAFVLLFAPLLVWIIAQGGAALTSTLLLGAIGMWISGVAVVALVVAVLCTYLHARAAVQ